MNYSETLHKAWEAMQFAVNDISDVAFHEDAPPMLRLLAEGLLADARDVCDATGELFAAVEGDSCK